MVLMFRSNHPEIYAVVIVEVQTTKHVAERNFSLSFGIWCLNIF
jgi:ribonucleotide reductase alpha subunit